MYLIADEVIGNYNLEKYISKYDIVNAMSKIGKKLNNELFIFKTDEEINWNSAMKATAWLTDTKNWEDLLDEEGKAIFAIASPTVELFINSYNEARNSENEILLEYDNIDKGYKISKKTDSDQYFELKIDEKYRNGIYSKGNFWISSPSPYQIYEFLIAKISNEFKIIGFEKEK